MSAERMLVDLTLDFYLCAECSEEEALDQLKSIGLSRGLEESICQLENVASGEIEELTFHDLSLEESDEGPAKGSVGCRARLSVGLLDRPSDLASLQSLAEQAASSLARTLISACEDSPVRLLESSNLSLRIDRDSQAAQVANSFSTSRAEIRRLMQSGGVRVNGQPLSDDMDILPGDEVQLGRRAVRTL